VRRARGAGRCDPLNVEDQRLHGGQAWPIDRALDDEHQRADASRSRGNGGTRRCGGPQEMTVRARLGGVVADLASRRTHFVPGFGAGLWGSPGHSSHAQTRVGHKIDVHVDFTTC